MTLSLPLTGRAHGLMRSLTAVTPVTTTRAIAHNRPFCDGYHIVKAKPAMWVYSSKWANGRVPCLLPLYLWKHLRRDGASQTGAASLPAPRQMARCRLGRRRHSHLRARAAGAD